MEWHIYKGTEQVSEWSLTLPTKIDRESTSSRFAWDEPPATGSSGKWNPTSHIELNKDYKAK